MNTQEQVTSVRKNTNLIPTLTDQPQDIIDAKDNIGKIARIVDSVIDNDTIKEDFPGFEPYAVQDKILNTTTSVIYAESGWENNKTLNFRIRSNQYSQIIPKSCVLNLAGSFTFADGSYAAYEAGRPDWMPVNDFFRRYYNNITLLNAEGNLSAPNIDVVYPSRLFTDQFGIIKPDNIDTCETFFLPLRRSNVTLTNVTGTTSDDNETRRCNLLKNKLTAPARFQIPLVHLSDFFNTDEPIADTKEINFTLTSTVDVTKLFRRNRDVAAHAAPPKFKLSKVPYISFTSTKYNDNYTSLYNTLMAKKVYCRSAYNNYYVGQSATIPQNGISTSLTIPNDNLTKMFLFVHVFPLYTVTKPNFYYGDMKEMANILIKDVQIDGVEKGDGIESQSYNLNDPVQSLTLNKMFSAYISGLKASSNTTASLNFYDGNAKIPGYDQWKNGLYKIDPLQQPAALSNENVEGFPLVFDLRWSNGQSNKMDRNFTPQSIFVRINLNEAAFTDLDVRVTALTYYQNGYIMRNRNINSTNSLLIPKQEKEKYEIIN